MQSRRRIAKFKLVRRSVRTAISSRRKITEERGTKSRRDGGALSGWTERFAASNLIYRGRRHRPVTERVRRARAARGRATRMHRALQRRPRHVRRSYFLAKSQSRQRRYCHVRVMNPDGETERSVGQYTIPS